MSKLFIVSTPIGNQDDITLRAIDTLKTCDAVICEELRIGDTLLNRLGISKDIFTLNEHNEEEKTMEYAGMIASGANMALISDCGTPCFSDPGRRLVNACRSKNLPVIPIPGANSLITALSVSGIDLRQFHFAGFPPREKQDREQFIKNSMQYNCPVIFMDTPYRLRNLLESVARFNTSQSLVLCMDLTKSTEQIMKGKASYLIEKIGSTKNKREFILIVDHSSKTSHKV